MLPALLLEEAEHAPALIEAPMNVLAVLLAVLAGLFLFNRTNSGSRIFRVLPLLMFAYFVPTTLSNTGVIPLSSELYDFIKAWFLPASLILLTISIDIPGIIRLGPPALIMFLGATVTIVLGGPIAFAALGWMVPVEILEEAWRGLAALSGSWIGGSANMIAIGESVGAPDSIMGLIIVVDIVVAETWMAFLLFFANREKKMDEKIGADRRSIDELRHKIETFQRETAKPTSLPDLLAIACIAFAGTAVARLLGGMLPEIGNIVSEFMWIVVISTTIGVGLSLTPVRKLEGVGASAIGSLLLYLLIGSIGAKAEFYKVVQAPELVAIGAVWMLFHAVLLLWLRRLIKAPIFLAAVGSRANIGGAASAPVLAAIFHPSLASVGVMLAIGGYVLGTYAGAACAFLIELVYDNMYAVGG